MRPMEPSSVCFGTWWGKRQKLKSSVLISHHTSVKASCSEAVNAFRSSVWALSFFFFPFFVWKASQFRHADCVGCRKCYWWVTIHMPLHLSGKEMSSGHLAPRLRLSATPRAHFRPRTGRPWCTKTTDLIMWVHRKVSEHCCVNHVSGHRLEAGQMLGKGQWGYVILIRRGLGRRRRMGGGDCESRLLPWRHLAKVNQQSQFTSCAQVSPFSHHLSHIVFVFSFHER